MQNRRRPRGYGNPRRKGVKPNFAPVIVILCLAVGCGYATAKYVVDPVVNYVPQLTNEKSQEAETENSGSLKTEVSSEETAEVVEGEADVQEEKTIAIKKVFGDDTKVPVSSTKSMTGHLLGAAGGLEAVICVKALIEGFIPPTAGLQKQDPELDLDYVPIQGREADLKYVLSNSLGFGGHNAALIMKKYED